MVIIKRLLPVGVLLDTLNVLPTYTKLSSKYNFRLLVFSQYEINWIKKTIYGLLLTKGEWKRQVCPFPQVVYNRIYAESNPVVSRLSKHLGVNKVFNQINHFDKWHVYKSLQNSVVGDYMPDSYLYQQDDLPNLIQQHQNIILKPRKGNQGLGIWRIQLLENGGYALYHDFDFPAILNNNQMTLLLLNYLVDPELYFVQKYISFKTINNHYFDIRVLVQKTGKGEWQPSATVSRIAKQNHFITNISNKSLDGFTVLNLLELPTIAIMEEIFELSKITANILEQTMGHLGEISVDFGLDKDNKPWIIEANGKPNKTLFKDVASNEIIDKIYLQPIYYAQHLIKNAS